MKKIKRTVAGNPRRLLVEKSLGVSSMKSSAGKDLYWLMYESWMYLRRPSPQAKNAEVEVYSLKRGADGKMIKIKSEVIEGLRRIGVKGERVDAVIYDNTTSSKVVVKGLPNIRILAALYELLGD